MLTKFKNMSTRHQIASVGGLVVALALGAFALDRADVVNILPEALDEALPGGDSSSGSQPGGDVTSEFEGGPDLLLYQSGDSLTRLSIVKQSEEDLGASPSTTQLVAAPGSRFFVYQETRSDGRTKLNLYDPDSAESTDLGLGSAPLWHPSGDFLAFVRPKDPECGGEDCPNEVVSYSVPDESATVLTEINRFALTFQWAGDHLLINDPKEDQVLAIGPGGASEPVEISPTEGLAVSPDGKWLISQDKKGAKLEALSDGVPTGDPQVIPLLGIARAASWSLDSGSVAVTLDPAEEINTAALIQTIANSIGDSPANVTRKLQKAPGKLKRALKGHATGKAAFNLLTKPQPSESEIVVLTPTDLEPVVVEQSRGAFGRALWSIDGKSVVITRLADPAQGIVQALHCPVASKGSCRTLLSWISGISLLRLE